MLKKMLSLLKNVNIKFRFTDGWEGYKRLLPFEKHIVGKKHMQTIEWRNLNFRTRIKRLARKTICFPSWKNSMIKSLELTLTSMNFKLSASLRHYPQIKNH